MNDSARADPVHESGRMSISHRIYLGLHGLVRRRLYASDEGPVASLLVLPLLLLGKIYFSCTRIRRSLYRSQLLRRHRVDAKVIGIGNLTVGGSGKTTITMELAEYLCREGCSVAVISRGYGGKCSRDEPTVVSRGRGPVISVDEAGDEPYMIAERLDCGVAVIIGKDRVKAARLAIREFGSKCLLLDDAFQFLLIHKDLEILLINESDLAGKRRPLPAGVFREPLASARDADVIVVMKGMNEGKRNSGVRALDLSIQSLLEAQPKRVRVMSVIPNRTEVPLEALRHRRMLAFASIARTESFERMLRDCDPEWFELREFPDHYRYANDELRVIREAAIEHEALIVTTEKDRVKVAWDLFQGVECFTISPRYDLFASETEFRRMIDAFIKGGSSYE
jgi:tetraacyldisaccharide 4'-kinase